MAADRAIEWCRVAAYVRCFDQNGRVVLSRIGLDGSRWDGGWTMPGGGMEWDEQPTDTAIREFREETGLAVTLGELVGVRSTWFDAHTSIRNQPGHSVGLLYEGADPRGVLRTDFTDDDTTTEAAWFTIDEVRSLFRVPLVDWALGLD